MEIAFPQYYSRSVVFVEERKVPCIERLYQVHINF